jgi:hypothetical protein
MRELARCFGSPTLTMGRIDPKPVRGVDVSGRLVAGYKHANAQCPYLQALPDGGLRFGANR